MDDDIREQLNRIENYARLGAKEVLNIEDVSILTGLSVHRIYALTSQKEIPHYKQGKLYFRKKEVESWLTSHPVKTKQEVESQAAVHCLKNTIKQNSIRQKFIK